ncbi:hypothetical protein BKM17_20755 [Pseudomonas syringae group genomosp. 3]|nr:hypothetical protein BKM17_20755 [Pseudomonas syringae group genomosp. 3]
MSWPLAKLRECCEVVGGATPKREVLEYWDSADVPWVTPKDVSGLASSTLEDAPEYISEAGFKSCSTSMLPKGSVLVTSRAPIGNIAIAGRDLSTNQGFKSLVPSERVDGLYLYYCMRHSSQRLQALGNGATFKEVSKKIVEEFEIPLPPLPEQKRIAAILDKADAIRRKRQQAIQLADDFLRAVFLDMFGDPNSNPKGADILSMTEVFNITTGKLNSNAAIEGGKYPFFTCAKEVYAIDDYAFDQEALLLAGNNAQADYDVKHFKGRFNAYQRTYVLTLRDSRWSYPFYNFALQYQLSNLKRSSKGSSTKYITMEIMSRTMLPVPSNGGQKKFLKYYDQMQTIQAALSGQAQSDENLFSALSCKAFSG